ncbi:MAG: EAL domain-containing protein [Wenzhouxiangella sp.]|jgi:EAL domain-containing protein (putative c-di-GMP-specific phosphodiesterase class I)/PleD family two-component response regulator|nr:EAL domain-containing protein [Wenzhouxiangella sp.]
MNQTRLDVQAQGPSVLLIDDDAMIRTLVSRGLGRGGVRVTETSGGAEALALMDQSSFDLVLLDVHMPDMDGFETLEAIRSKARRGEIPVIMLTADDEPSAIEKAFERGATDFITKPINLRLLEQRIRYAMAGHARENRLRELQAERASACQIARLGFWRLTESDNFLEWSEGASTLLGRPTVMPGSLAEFLSEIHPDDRLRLDVAFNSALSSGQPFDLESRLRYADEERLVRFSSPGHSDNDALVGSFQDVTSLRKLEAQVLYLSEHDELTGLPRQRLFSKSAEERLASRTGQGMLLVVISIHHVLKFTEYLGSRITQEATLKIAQRLRSFSPDAAIIGRLEENLFALALNTHDQQPEALAQSLHDNLALPLEIGTREIPVRVVMGVAHSLDHGTEVSELIRSARLACRLALEQRLDGVHLYTSDSGQDYGTRLTLEADLRIACAQEQFFLVFQPQVDIHSGQVIGAEALLRWRHPERGVVSPGEFIPVLEETGLIEQAGAWVLAQGIADAARLRKEGFDLRMGINLSAVQLRLENLPETLTELCKEHELPHRRLELEITEGMAMHDPIETRVLLEKLKSRDFSLSIDDFGTGHSALSYITDFPVDTIKIDRSFVINITEGRKQRAIVTAISALSAQLGLTTIAEGIENERQRDYVDALGVHEIQGFLISRPLPFDEFRLFLSTHGKYRRIQEST